MKSNFSPHQSLWERFFRLTHRNSDTSRQSHARTFGLINLRVAAFCHSDV